MLHIKIGEDWPACFREEDENVQICKWQRIIRMNETEYRKLGWFSLNNHLNSIQQINKYKINMHRIVTSKMNKFDKN